MKRSAKQEKKKIAGTAVDLRSLAEYVEQFSGKTVVVVGDFVADAFQFGDITRVSREAPVLILKHRETQIVPGGGANAANNFAALGAKVIPVTAVGEDEAGHKLVEFFRAKKVDVSGIVRVKEWTTPTKTRFLAGWAHKVGQQVLRVDYEPEIALPESVLTRLKMILASKIRNADALAISDYGFGVATPESIAAGLARAKKGIVSTLDSRYGLGAFKRVGIHSATPNEGELETMHHTAIGKDLEELERCGRETLEEMKLDSLVVTRGRDGIAVFQDGQPTAHIPIHGSDQPVDVTGAGDTVLAAYTLGLSCGASPLEAAHLANIAGGLVVMKRGTATISRQELLEAIGSAASETTH